IVVFTNHIGMLYTIGGVVHFFTPAQIRPCHPCTMPRRHPRRRGAAGALIELRPLSRLAPAAPLPDTAKTVHRTRSGSDRVPARRPCYTGRMLTTAALLESINRRHGTSFALRARYPDGEQGAFALNDAAGA